MSSVSSGWNEADDHVAVAQQHGLAVELGEHLDARSDLAHARRTDEDAAQRRQSIAKVDVTLEARNLTPVGVAIDLDVDEPQMGAVEQDHPGTRAEDRSIEHPDRVAETVEVRELRHRRRLPTGDHEPVEPVELRRQPHLDRVGAEPAEHLQVLAKRALQRENTDAGSAGSHAPIVTTAIYREGASAVAERSASSSSCSRVLQRKRTLRIAVSMIASESPNPIQAQWVWNSLSSISFASVVTAKATPRHCGYERGRPAAHREPRDDDRHQFPDDDRDREQRRPVAEPAVAGYPPTDAWIVVRSGDLADALPGREHLEQERDREEQDDPRPEGPIPERTHAASLDGRNRREPRAAPLASAPGNLHTWMSIPFRRQRCRNTPAGGFRG